MQRVARISLYDVLGEAIGYLRTQKRSARGLLFVLSIGAMSTSIVQPGQSWLLIHNQAESAREAVVTEHHAFGHANHPQFHCRGGWPLRCMCVLPRGPSALKERQTLAALRFGVPRRCLPRSVRRVVATSGRSSDACAMARGDLVGEELRGSLDVAGLEAEQRLRVECLSGLRYDRGIALLVHPGENLADQPRGEIARSVHEALV